MTDDRLVRLVEEIRDIQLQVVEHQQQALRAQAESIGMQQAAQAFAQSRLRAVPFLIVVVLVLVVVVLGMMIHALL